MNRFLKALASFALFAALASLVSAPIQQVFGIPEPVTFVAAAVAVLGCAALGIRQANHIGGVMRNGIQVELWANYIIQRLRKDNKFIQFAYSDDQYVLAGKVVHIPQPGSRPTVVKNRSSYPATAAQRTDTEISYSLDVYTTDPTHIIDADKHELSYAKMDDVLGDHIATLGELIGDDMLIKWAGTTAPAVVNTTGSAAAATVTGQTGNRNVLIHDDLRKAKLKLDLQNIPAEDRYMLLEANQADQLFASLANTQYRDFSMYADAANGIVGKLYGWNIMVRSNVLITTVTTNATAALGAAVGATDNVASIGWHKNAVTRALGDVTLFQRENDPLYYGDIYSSLVRMGGRQRRTAGEGVVAIIGA